MKKLTFFFILLIGILYQNELIAQVAVNTTGDAPHASAMLEITSTTKGMLIPRMTKTQREAITGMETGLMVFQTDDFTGFYFYNGSKWLRLDNGDRNALINNAASETLGLTYLGQAKTDANNNTAFRFKSAQGYFIDLNHLHQIGTSWILYSGANCTGTPYATPVFYGPGAVFASPENGNLFYVSQSATIQNSTTIQSRYIVSNNTCQSYSETGDYYPVLTNVAGTTGISLSANTAYKVTFE